ncbi:permease prefix domain 1-containing protein [uncultured Deinococcus sp.]|uniref:permease prefix domain 1-containing protein n=1 Tax=uncultured Deinococcus sp. TaxID=158789 RepID=UPI0025E52D65|nr:permease prefix domain 1-containing protein [uncultured Deinococcus sp.]
MSATDRYLHRATRGLWGQRKRDALMELRGAIEDKIYRHRLCGLSEIEAERAALRDLGSPAAIARELGVVHTGPQVMRVTLLLGVAGLLGMRAAAQLPTVQAVPVPVEVNCTFDDAKLARFSPADQTMVLERIAKAGGRAAYEAACRARVDDGSMNDLVSLPDVLAALRSAGVETRTLPGLDSWVQFRLPGDQWQSVDLTGATVPVPAAAGPFVFAAGLVNLLRGSFVGTLKLTGIVNPILHLGAARMQLGTAARPVRATNVVSLAVADEFEHQLARVSGSGEVPTVHSSADDGPHASRTRLAVPGPDGTLYALVGTEDRQFRLAVRAAQRGTVELPCDCGTVAFGQTGDLKMLLDWNRQGRTGLLVYAVNATDLHDVKLTPVPAAQVTREEP